MDTFTLHIGSTVVASLNQTREVPVGQSILDALSQFERFEDIAPYLAVELEGGAVPRDMWGAVRPKAGVLVSVGLAPGIAGGNDIIRTVATIAAMFGSNALAQSIGGFRGGVVQVALSIATWWLFNTLLPSPTDEDTVQTQQGLRNDLRRWQKIPRVYGRWRLWPPLQSEPVMDVIGNELYSRAVFALGQRPLRVVRNSIKLGETDIGEFKGVEYEIHDGWRNPSTQPFAIYSRDYQQQLLNREIAWAAEWLVGPSGSRGPGGTVRDLPNHYRLDPNVITLETAPDTVEFQLDLTFPDGLGVEKGSEFDGYNVDLEVRFRPKGATGDKAWINVTQDAVAGQLYSNGEVHPITGTELFAWLEDLNDLLDALLVDLTAISLGERILTEALFYFATQRLPQTQQILLGSLSADTEFTEDQRELIEQTQTKLDDFGLLFQDVLRTTEEISDEILNFNQLVSKFIVVLEAIDGILAYGEYVDRGYGPPTPNVLRFLAAMFNPWVNQVFSEPPTGAFRLINADRAKGPIRKKISMPVARGKYEVQVRRVSMPIYDTSSGADPEEPRYSDNVKERVDLTAFISVQQGSPSSARRRERTALMAMKIRLSNQTQSIDGLNLIVESPLPWYKPGEGWQAASLYDDDARPVFKCPAWIALDIRRGTGNKRPPTDGYIDVERWCAFADYCFDNDLYFSGVFDAKSTVDRAIDDVLRVAKASRCMRFGMFSVVWDEVKTTRVDVITPVNSSNTRVRRLYADPPHALRIPFKNPDKGWADDEWIVYDDTHGDTPREISVTRPAEGAVITLPLLVESVERLYYVTGDYEVPAGSWVISFPAEFPGTTRISIRGASALAAIVGAGSNWPAGEYRAQCIIEPEAPAERFELIDMKGLVDSFDTTSTAHTGQVYKLGRYLLKCLYLRREIITKDMGFSYLKFGRGDLVGVQDQVLLWGLGSARLAADPVRDGDNKVTEISVDAAFPMASGKLYAVLIRDSADNTYTADVATVAGRNLTLTLTTPLDAPDVARNDLVVFGERSRVVIPCIVRDIETTGNLTAQVTLIEHAPAVHDAPEEPIPPFDSNITIPPQIEAARPPMPEVLSITTDETVLYRDAGGTLQSQIRVAFRVPEGTSDTERATVQRVSHVEAQFRLSFRFTPGQLFGAYIPDAQQQWISSGYIERAAGVVYLSPVQEGYRYDVRLRCVTRAGVPGEWNLTESVEVLGKTSPPPDVQNVRIEGDELRWDYPVPPADLAGFQVRQLRGIGGSWAIAGPAHDGVISQTRLSIAQFQGGPREFYVRAIDTSGNLSARAGVAGLGGGGVPAADEITRYSHRDNNWPGTALNMSEDSDDLAADAGSMSSFYAGPGAPYYRGPSSDYYTTDYPEAAYEFDHVVDGGDLPYRLGVDILATGDVWQLEVRKVDAWFWPSDGRPLWPRDSRQSIWPERTYRPYNGRIEAEADTTYRFRVSAPGCNSQLRIEELDEVTTPAERSAS